MVINVYPWRPWMEEFYVEDFYIWTVDPLESVVVFTYYVSYIWTIDTFERCRFLLVMCIVMLRQNSSSRKPYIWLVWYIWYVQIMVVLLCWMYGYSHETPWTQWESLTHTLMILRLKGHYHLINLWATMILWWYECYAFFHE